MSYYDKPENVDEYIQMAEGFDGAELIKRLEKHLPANSTILELGSGPGKDLAILQKRYHVTGSDLSSPFIEKAKEKVPQIDFLQLDAVTLDTDRNFDCIYSNKVLHHLNWDELTRSLKRQFEQLNQQGLIAHSFWLGDGSSEIFKGLYVLSHDPQPLIELVNERFQVVDSYTYAEFDEGDSLFLIAKKVGQTG